MKFIPLAPENVYLKKKDNFDVVYENEEKIKTKKGEKVKKCTVKLF